MAVPDAGISHESRAWSLGLNGTLVCVLYSVIGGAMATIIPSLVGALVDRFGASPSEAGGMASVELGGAAIGAGLVLVLARRLSSMTIAVCGAICLAASVFACMFLQSLVLITAVWLVAGLGGGMVTSAIYKVGARHPRPARLYGLMLIGQMTFGFVCFLILPTLVEHGELRVVYALLAVLCIAGVALARQLRGDVLMDAAHAPALRIGLQQSPGAVLMSFAILMHYVSTTMLWSYSDRIGAAAGADANLVGNTLAGSMATGLAGALVSTQIAKTVGDALMIVTGILMVAAADLLLLVQHSGTAFFISILWTNFAVMFALPSFFGFLASLEREDNAVPLGTLQSFLGLMIGPAVGAVLVARAGFRAIIISGALLFLAALAFALAAVWRRRKARKEEVLF
jgi:predicted MFS family arabinose efflux permease